MTFIIDILKGAIIGIANVIPGVSGGTMAVSLGIYNKLISAVSNIFKSFKKSIMTLLPIILGCAIGIVFFSYSIEYLLENYTFLTCMVFIGLILGGVPLIFDEMSTTVKRSRTRRYTLVNVFAFVFFFALAIALPLIGGNDNALTVLTPSPMLAALMFFIGIIVSATMVVPGISGSMLLMIFGYYYGVINSITSFVDALRSFQLTAALTQCAILVPFGIGAVIGIFLVAKIINYLFARHTVSTYMAILGLVLAGPFGILYNTGALAYATVSGVIIGLILLVLAAILTFVLSAKTSN